MFLVVTVFAAGCAFGPVSPVANQEPASESGGRTTQDNWITFTNETLLYVVDHPPGAQVDLLDKSGGSVRLQLDEGEPFELRAKADYQPGDVNLFLDTAAVGERQTGEFTWQVFVLPDGYCDAQGCSPPIYAHQMEQNGILYQVIVETQDSTIAPQDSVLATWRLLT